MSTRTLAILAAVAAGLALVAVLVLRDSGDETSSTGRPVDLSAYTDASTDGISITRPDSKAVVLSKVDGRWKVGGKDADPDQVKAFLKELRGIDSAVLVSRKASAQERLGTAPSTAAKVKLGRDGASTTLLVGQAGDAPGTVYIRTTESPRTWQVEADLTTYTGRDAAGWNKQSAAKGGGSTETPTPGAVPGMPGAAAPAGSSRPGS